MIALGDHAEFILAAYAGVFVTLALVISWTVVAARRTTRRLEELGDTRRADNANP
ncbi:heme exporter protein D [Devosia crocina]|uniref:Heme exporter protein D n=1 Tax=Devosia crocina TaxID=429728 RepID=A0A1I7NSA0_9HYPH|nr:heme exporter protein CcmD [Devosia crocina]SFV37549.1 heme exporter protein D [Devosia crocina]